MSTNTDYVKQIKNVSDKTITLQYDGDVYLFPPGITWVAARLVEYAGFLTEPLLIVVGESGPIPDPPVPNKAEREEKAAAKAKTPKQRAAAKKAAKAVAVKKAAAAKKAKVTKATVTRKATKESAPEYRWDSASAAMVPTAPALRPSRRRQRKQ